jgi:predicted transcriptional regulator
MMTPQATTKNDLSWEDVLCSRTTMKILKTLKKYQRLNTSEIVRHVGSNFQVTASHLKLLEDQDILTHSSFGARVHIYRFDESLRAKAVLKLLEAWE